ncbi:MAG TPA: class I SAM-dependent methyltransferase [Gaiellaceae bacterium]|jgi:SAM-dependent methyltransferase|nr:class I SAM-dependent methyltransferase [Gaiellaceae bacterium]
MQTPGERIAILSTPRSGNMWLRRLVGAIYDLEDLSADTPAAVPWTELPKACALQLHWPPTESLLEQFDRAGFSVVALARHPLDVLVSILRFSQNEPRTARWLNGEGGTERSLLGAEPCSDAFRAYATGPRAAALLSVTVDWWRSPRLDAPVQFEELVAAPQEVLERVTDTLGGAPPERVSAAIQKVTFESLRLETGNDHFWRGRPGHWRSLMTADDVAAVVRAHPEVFRGLGYEADADARLTEEQARANWRALTDNVERATRLEPPTTGQSVDAHLQPTEAPRVFVEEAYRLVLRREPDAQGVEQALDRLARGLVSPSTLVHELAGSREGRRVRALDDAIAFARWARAANERPRELEAPAEVDECAIAIPWALARYRGEADVLDIGHAFADPAHLAALVDLGAARLVAVDVAPADLPRLDNVCADVRDLPFTNSSIDVAFCLGTLQHVGRDNRAYGGDADVDPDGELRALRELRRVLRAGGRALVTVPCGDEQDLGMFVQHTPAEWRRLFTAAGFFALEFEVYELGVDGWRSTVELSGALRYSERGRSASAVLCAELRPGRVRQSLRRSLRAVRGVKATR